MITREGSEERDRGTLTQIAPRKTDGRGKSCSPHMLVTIHQDTCV